jgi:hypothetical protein
LINSLLDGLLFVHGEAIDNRVLEYVEAPVFVHHLLDLIRISLCSLRIDFHLLRLSIFAFHHELLFCLTYCSIRFGKFSFVGITFEIAA